MAVIKCKMCGGDMTISPDKTIGTCEYCGCQMTLPKIDDDQRAAMFNRGNHFRRTGEFDKALAVYERIVAEDDSDAEAHWCCALCRFGIEYVEDPNTYEYVPTCHRASFESILQDVDYLAAIEHSDGITRRQYQKDAAKIAEVQKGVLAASQNEEPYDVFICYKETDAVTGERSRDSLDAQEVYYRLTEKGCRVFFSRITLEDKAGTEYEPYIFAALNSAKVMIVLGSRPEHFSAVWVKNEWSRFLALMKKDRSKLLIPCYKNMDPYDLPEQLAVLQSYDMTKIGFMQDLIRGVDKVLNAEKPKEVPTRETVVVQQSGEAAARTSAALKRGNMALEDGEFDRAKEFFDQVLSLDAENAGAYLGMFLAGKKAHSTQEFIDSARQQKPQEKILTLPQVEAHVRDFIKEKTVPNYLPAEQLRGLYNCDLRYTSRVEGARKLTAEVMDDLKSDKNLSRAFRFAKGEEKVRLDAFRSELTAALKDLEDKAVEEEAQNRAKKAEEYKAFLAQADAKAEEMYCQACEQRENEYQQACRSFTELKTSVAFRQLMTRFAQLSGYKDAGKYWEKCRTEFGRLEKTEREEKLSALLHSRKRAENAAGLIAAGLSHTVGLRADGTVVAVGCGDDGRCDVVGWSNIIAVAAGRGHTVGLRSNGTVVAMGRNAYGQCNVSDWTDIIAVAAGGQCTVGLRADGTVVAVGLNNSGQCNVAGWKNIAAVAAGDQHTVGLCKDGTVVAVGESDYGQCGGVRGWRDIVAVAAGDQHTVGLRQDGTVSAVGRKTYGQCSVSSWTGWTGIIAVAAGGQYTVGLRADGTVMAVGDIDHRQCGVSGWTDVVAIAAGTFHTTGLRSDGTVVAVGSISSGECSVSSWKLFDNFDALVTARNEKREALKKEKASLEAELPTLKGILSAFRRKQIEVRLAKIEQELKKLR